MLQKLKYGLVYNLGIKDISLLSIYALCCSVIQKYLVKYRAQGKTIRSKFLAIAMEI